MTAHLVMPAGHPDDAFLQHATEQLHGRFQIEHVTLQVVRTPFTRPCEIRGGRPEDDRAATGVSSHAEPHGPGGARSIPQ